MPEHLSASKIVHDFLRGKSLLLRRPATRRDLIRENIHPILHSISLTIFSVQKEHLFEDRYNIKRDLPVIKFVFISPGLGYISIF